MLSEDTDAAGYWLRSGLSAERIAETIGCTVEDVLIDGNGAHVAFVPTPEQIAIECAKIRSRWDDAEFRERAGLTSVWTAPEVAVMGDAA